MKKVTSLFLALCILLTLAACGGGAAPTQAPATQAPATQAPATQAPATEAPPEPTEEPEPLEPIKIGHLVDLQGTEALTGEEARKALEFAVAQLGGEFAGRPVEIVVGDCKGDASAAMDEAKRLVEQEGVAAIFGPTQAGQKAAVAGYMNEAGVPLIFYSGSPAYLFAGNDWLVGAGGANPQIPTVIADYAYNELGYRTVHSITMDNVGFRGFTDDFKAAFEALGGKVITEQYAPLPCGDWAPFLASLEDADAIAAWSTGSDAIALWTTWVQMGVNERMPILPVMQAAFTDYYILNALSNSVPAAVDSILEGTFSPTMYTYDIDTPENKAFIEAWVGEFGSVPATNLPGQCYQAALLLKTALEATVGDSSPEVLIEAILDADIVGPCGRLFFDGTGAATKDVYIVKNVQLEDGSFNYEIVTKYADVPPAGLK